MSPDGVPKPARSVVSHAMYTLDDGGESYHVKGRLSRDENGVATVTLKHPYPDLAIQPGWSIVGRDVDGLVASVDGTALVIEE